MTEATHHHCWPLSCVSWSTKKRGHSKTKVKGLNRVMEARGGEGGSIVQCGVLVAGDGSVHCNSGAGKVELEEEAVGNR